MLRSKEQIMSALDLLTLPIAPIRHRLHSLEPKPRRDGGAFMVALLDDKPKYNRDTLVESLIVHESAYNGTNCSCGWAAQSESDIYADHLADVYEVAIQSSNGNRY
jgi:hypothetical protein